VALGRVAQELQYRTDLEGWSPRRVLLARDRADGGALQDAADCVEALLTDDRVDGVLSTRTHGLLGLPLHFSEGSPDARTYLAGVGDKPGEWWHMHDEAELARMHTWGLVLGVGLAQRIALPRLPEEKQRYRIETWSPRWLRFDDTTKKWFLQTKEGEIEIQPGDGQWILYLPYGSHRPWAAGKWNSLVFAWLLKRFSLEDRANHSQTTGGSFLVAKAPLRSTDKQRRKMQSDMQNMSRDSRFVMPAGWEMQIVEATGRTWDIYTAQVEWADKAITIVLAGQIVTTEGALGFSSGNIHDQIKGDFIRFDAERLSTCLAQQSLELWAEINYGKASDAPWPVWNVERPTNLEQQARTYEILGRSIVELDLALKSEGKKVDVLELMNIYNVPVKIAPPAPEPAPVAEPGAQPEVSP
jgi:hypothetical protein